MTQRRVLLVTELTTARWPRWPARSGSRGPRPSASCRRRPPPSRCTARSPRPTSARCSRRSALHVESNRWPRPTIIRRAGATRRRTHTVIGVAATAAALVVAGTLVTDADGVRPTLAGERIDATEPVAGPPKPHVVDLPEETMLAPRPSPRRCPGTAAGPSTRTDDNSAGTGKAVACQQTRYAAPRNRRTPPGPRLRPRTGRRARRGPQVAQAAEASRTPSAAPAAASTPPRLVLQLPRRPGPAARRPTTSGGRATRRCSSCCAPGPSPNRHRRRGRPHRQLHDHDREHQPRRQARAAARSPAARQQRRPALRAPRGRHLLDRATPRAAAPVPVAQAPGDARRGRPAAGRRREAAVGRHRAAQGPRQRGGDPAATARLQLASR